MNQMKEYVNFVFDAVEYNAFILKMLEYDESYLQIQKPSVNIFIFITSNILSIFEVLLFIYALIESFFSFLSFLYPYNLMYTLMLIFLLVIHEAYLKVQNILLKEPNFIMIYQICLKVFIQFFYIIFDHKINSYLKRFYHDYIHNHFDFILIQQYIDQYYSKNMKVNYSLDLFIKHNFLTNSSEDNFIFLNFLGMQLS